MSPAVGAIGKIGIELFHQVADTDRFFEKQQVGNIARPLAVLDLGARGQHEDQEAAIRHGLLDMATQLFAGHLRHLDVGDQHVGFLDRQARQCLLAIGAELDRVALAFERHLEYPQNVRFVIGDQYFLVHEAASSIWVETFSSRIVKQLPWSSSLVKLRSP